MLVQSLTIRESQPSDLNAIQDLCLETFNTDYEARICETLISDETTPTISLVAANSNDEIAGHILISEGSCVVPSGLLGPLCVAPQYREFGVGRTLVRRAIDIAKEQSMHALFVLGSPMYYGQFGFSSALADPFESPYQGKNFQALELSEGALSGKTGPITYPRAFD